MKLYSYIYDRILLVVTKQWRSKLNVNYDLIGFQTKTSFKKWLTIRT